MKIKKLRIMMLLSALSCAALLNGCGSSSKEGTTGNAAFVEEGTCIGCHSTTTDPVSGNQIVKEYASSIHNPANTPANTTVNAKNPNGCQGCHGSGAQHNGVGPIPFPNPLASSRCIVCHTTAIAALFTTDLVSGTSNEDFAGKCSPCHSDGNTGIHGANLPNRDDCVGCHNVVGGIPTPPHRSDKIVNDNSGVRPIVSEFTKSSHHIVNADGSLPTNAQCAVCHAEGTVASDGSIVVDHKVHMKDGNIYLRNGNTALGQTPPKFTSISTTVGAKATNVSVYAWNPAVPDQTLMDQFCFSCHNAAGAPTTFATLGNGIKDVNLKNSNATNPFGDAISNGYDQMARSAVVNVYDAFDPNNTSHHAVRAKKYTGRTRTGVTGALASADPTNAPAGRIGTAVANPALFTQYSGKAVNPGTVVPYKNGNAGIGPKSPGSRYTIYEAGYFVSNYTPLSATATVGDDSTLHCGDCHTVGQWKPNSTTAVTSNPDGSTTVVTNVPAIGAHGSVNEYMLRTSDGTDTLHHQNTVDGASITSQNVGGTYVCFLCHRQGVYGSDEQYQRYAANPAAYPAGYNPATRLGGHAGLHPCNAPGEGESTGMTGSQRIWHTASVSGDGGGGGNLFGYTCGNCHNSGNKGFGGIHGGNAAWGTYSTNGAYASATNLVTIITNRKPYRLMGGLSLRYNGGGSAAKWESQTLQQNNREGCYNFTVGPTGVNAATNTQWVVGSTRWPAGVPNITGVVSPAGTTASTEFTDGANANQTFGTWGGCGQHYGTTTAGGGEPTLRKVQRPLTY